uniref:Uncharacterized protein n=1 Tax=Anopheles maculatus TaxID=74869 RepID=A0A182SA52_9DIPT
MGLKASTVAMNHHHHHLNDVGAGGNGGTKTRHATELAATLLECEGLDPKNTKRISLGLRQNPKRANLNEDFTSLLDETLERSKSSSSAAVARRTGQAHQQSRIRLPTKGKLEQQVSVATTTTKQQHAGKAEDEKLNRGEEDEQANRDTVVEHDRQSSKQRTAVSKKAAALEDIKVRGIRWRAPSPTTRPPVKSPLLYKVIDHQAGEEPISPSERITSSSRSSTASATITSRKDASSTVGSGSVATQQQQPNHHPRASKCSKLTGGPSPTKKNGLIVKIRRVRQSELSLLNDEAENFMFPKKDDSSSEEDTDDDRQTSSEGFQAHAGTNNYSLDLASS